MDRIEIPNDLFQALDRGAVGALGSGSVFEVSGPGAATCLQGLHTNDLEQRGPDAMVYGAFLTPKGMILADLWAARAGGDYLLLGDPAAREPTRDLFRRRLPPRLARATDHSDEWRVLFLIGPDSRRIAARLSDGTDSPNDGGVALPEPGHALRSGSVWIGAGTPTAPFALFVAGPAASVEALAEKAEALGARTAGPEVLRAARLLAGVPTLGAEIGERTLPQEVRFDELDGVSYAKGCYVGQETVARVHFRGHPNWQLRGLRFENPTTGSAAEASVRAGSKDVGRITGVLSVAGAAHWALAILRREVEPGTTVETALGAAAVVPLPIER